MVFVTASEKSRTQHRVELLEYDQFAILKEINNTQFWIVSSLGAALVSGGPGYYPSKRSPSLPRECRTHHPPHPGSQCSCPPPPAPSACANQMPDPIRKPYKSKKMKNDCKGRGAPEETSTCKKERKSGEILYSVIKSPLTLPVKNP